jgi:RHS repeat-associated protein
MFRKHVFGLAVFFVMLMVFGMLRTSAQEGSILRSAGKLHIASAYETKLSAVRQTYAAQRLALGLNSESDESSTPEVALDLGEPSCQDMGGGGSGGSSPAEYSGKSAMNSSCLASSKGAPVWVVNMVNVNFYMADTPLWYESPVGPSVEFKLSYNSLTSHSGNFGHKWQLNYESILYSVVDNYGLFAGFTIIMPDGKQDLYKPDGSGGYKAPYQTFNKLTQLATNHFELKFPDGMVYVYNIPDGVTSTVSLLVEIRDAYGQKLSMGYSAGAKLTTITDALGKVTTISYNTDGLVIQAADPFGRAASFEYDANKNLTKITDIGGYWTRFIYRHYMLMDYYLESLTNAGGSWGFYFEPANGPENTDPYPALGTSMGSNYRITVTNPSDDKEEYYRSGSSSWYISPKNYIPYIDAGNNNYASNVPKTVYGRNGGNVASIESPEGDVTNFTFDSTGNLTGISNGYLNIQYTYNTMGKVTSITDSNNAVTTLSYAANEVDMTGITNGLGTIALVYNAAHDITSHTDRSGNTASIAYNTFGNIISKIDPLNITTNFIYDANYRLTQSTRGGQILNSYTYDALGRVQTHTDATGMTINYEYNSLNDVTKITYPDGRYTSITYSIVFPHLITGITDRGGRMAQYVYDSSQNITRVVHPDGGITRFVYDANGNRIQLTDPKGQVTSFAYDNSNRLITKTFADGTASSYTYDSLSRIASYIGPRNMSTSYTFNSNNNLAYISHSTSDVKYYTMPSTYQHDAYRRLTGVTDDSGTTAYSYNADSLVTSINGPLGNDTITYQYDAKGQVKSYSLELGQTVSYTNDALDRLTAISGDAGNFAYSYTGASPLVTRLTRPNGSYTDYQYDSLNRLVSVANKISSGETISQYGYTYNDKDLIAGETATSGAPVTSFVNGQTTYSYNNINELLSTTNPAQTFTYDTEGNMTQWNSPEGKIYTGIYDIRNRLRSTGWEYFTITPILESESYTVNYKYGDDGHIGEKEVEYSKYSTSTYWTKKVMYVVDDYLPLQERDDSNNILGEYTWGLHQGGGIGGLLSLKQGGQNYYYLYDGKGNVTAVIDSSQTVVAAYTYDPFGNLLTSTGSLDQPYQFSTKPYDQATGLSYFGKRFYSPSAGRWTTRDPIGERGGLNLYGFVGNNPINYIDPIGLIWPFSDDKPVPTKKERTNFGPEPLDEDDGPSAKEITKVTKEVNKALKKGKCSDKTEYSDMTKKQKKEAEKNMKKLQTPQEEAADTISTEMQGKGKTNQEKPVEKRGKQTVQDWTGGKK